MGDSKTMKKSKSKSNKNDRTKPAKLFSQSQFPVTSSGTLPKYSSSTFGPKNEAFAKKKSNSVPGSILDKLDLDNLKDAALKKMKAEINSSVPGARETCIEYTLDMVINSLISNGNLDPNKAQQMKNPIMKAKIAAICEDMISAKQEICNARIAKYFRGRKKASKHIAPKTRSRSRSVQKQMWAIQPSLPITIVTDCKMPKFTTTEKLNLSVKDKGSVKSLTRVPTETAKKQKSGVKSRTKSLDSSTERNVNESKSQRSPSPRTSVERKNVYHQQASSEVPSSNHSLENNLKLLSSTNNAVVASCSKVTQPSTHGLVSTSQKQVEDTNRNVTISNSRNIEVNKKTEVDSAETPIESSPQNPGFDRNRLFTPAPTVPPTCATPPKSLNTLIRGSSCSLASSVGSTGFQCLVDMKGFQNDEISMEVEGRTLVFLASRPKRDELNIRKVTEIVEVPQKVNMENLKIGRRIDGYVIVEEHDT